MKLRDRALLVLAFAVAGAGVGVLGATDEGVTSGESAELTVTLVRWPYT